MGIVEKLRALRRAEKRVKEEETKKIHEAMRAKLYPRLLPLVRFIKETKLESILGALQKEARKNDSGFRFSIYLVAELIPTPAQYFNHRDFYTGEAKKLTNIAVLGPELYPALKNINDITRSELWDSPCSVSIHDCNISEVKIVYDAHRQHPSSNAGSVKIEIAYSKDGMSILIPVRGDALNERQAKSRGELENAVLYAFVHPIPFSDEPDRSSGWPV